MAAKGQEKPDDEVQKTFDWTKEEFGGEVTEGVKFDPELDYTLELTDMIGKVVTKGDKSFNILELYWAEESTDVKFKQSHFLGKYTVNIEKPEKSSSVVRLANALGIKVNKGDKIHPKNFLRKGMKIKARIVPQMDKSGKDTGFSEIDISSIRKSGGKSQTQITHDAGLMATFQKEITDGVYTTKEKYIQTLASTGRAAEIAPFVAMCDDGKIRFP